MSQKGIMQPISELYELVHTTHKVADAKALKAIAAIENDAEDWRHDALEAREAIHDFVNTIEILAYRLAYDTPPPPVTKIKKHWWQSSV